MAKLFFPKIFVFIIGIASWIVNAQVPALPQLDLNEWWGPNELKFNTNTTITPYKIRFSPNLIEDLRWRLKNHREFAPPLEGTAFRYGFNTDQLEPWKKYWLEEYDFKQQEAFLNQFPHYKTSIQGLNIHFIRVKPQVPAGVKVVPLLLIHGWLSSFREFYDAIHLLTKATHGYEFVFEVIVPSLPGFAFSDPAVRPGLGYTQIGVVLRNLMNRLGYSQFYIQAGDWGSVIATSIVTLFPKEVLGFHSNMHFALNSCTEIQTIVQGIGAALSPPGSVSSPFVEETGYFHLQATKPDTVGVGLTDSPFGLLAYILEKYSSLTRLDDRDLEDGGLYDHFSREQLIDNLMVYWSSNCITSSMRIYAEGLSNRNRAMRINEFPTQVPHWVLHAKYDYLTQPLNHLKFHNILGITNMDDGGHFIAMEKPQPYAADVFKAVKAFMEFHSTRNEL